MFVLAAATGFFLRRRKLRAHTKAQIDRALTEELAGGMRSIDSWYEGPTLRTEASNPHDFGSGGADAPEQTCTYETPDALMEVKLREQAAAAKRLPLQLQLSRLHFNLGNRMEDRNALNRNDSGMIVSPQEDPPSPNRRRGRQGLDLVHENDARELEGSTGGGTGTWPIAPPPQRPWEFQRSVVSLREMDGTGVNPLEQPQSANSGEYEDVVVNTDSTTMSEWQIERPWQIQKPPSLREMDGTGRLQLPAW